MAKNKVQKGSVLSMVHTAAVTAGSLFKKGAIIGVVLDSAPANTEFQIATEEVWELDKVTADNLAVGDTAYADDTLFITSDATDNPAVGYVVEAAGAGTDTVKVRLLPKATA